MAEADFIRQLGRPLLAHRLKRASDQILASMSVSLPKLGLQAPPTSGSTMLLLREYGPLPVTEIAARLRLSHPMIIKLAASLAKQGLVQDKADPRDNRRRLIALTAKGEAQADRLRALFDTLGRAFENVYEEAEADLFAAVEAFEKALERHPLEQRIEEAARQTAGGD